MSVVVVTTTTHMWTGIHKVMYYNEKHKNKLQMGFWNEKSGPYIVLMAKLAVD